MNAWLFYEKIAEVFYIPSCAAVQEVLVQARRQTSHSEPAYRESLFRKMCFYGTAFPRNKAEWSDDSRKLFKN